MKQMRRAYYDGFSTFYDRFVALHSRDPQGTARSFLVDQLHLRPGDSVLDVCTGTASLLVPLQEKVGADGHVVGLDFSPGMLNVARGKTRSFANICLVEADAGCLPFNDCTFDAVTCSHAFYELKGETQGRALAEIHRVLKPNGAFFMMEHDVPQYPLTKALFYLRLTFIGAGRAVTFLRHEKEVLQKSFRIVEKVMAPGGRSKVMICRK